MLDLRLRQLVDALRHAADFHVIGIVGDLRAVIVPVGETANGRRQEQDGRHGSTDDELLPAAAAMAVPKSVELQPQQLGDDFDDRLLLAQLLDVDAQHGLLATAKRGRKTLPCRVGHARLTRHDEGHDAVAPAHREKFSISRFTHSDFAAAGEQTTIR